MAGDPPGRSYGRKSIRATVKPRALMEQEELADAWAARIITLFPETFPGVLGASLTGKALKEGKWQLHTTDLRLFGEGRHRNVDDTPAGGGAGMVLRADIVGRAVDATHRSGPILCMSPRGVPFTQSMAARLARGPGCTILCGRFEGVDERAIDHYGMQEVSIGDYVLTGGELAAQVLLDATVRLLPGVLGNEASIEDESHSNGLLEHPHYTRPAKWQGKEIPSVLTSGHHGAVEKWRRAQSEALTKARRPDLWSKRGVGE
ncbi:MAG: tRNA (guanosine(37)-N1)-methyltransferase TrmD [Pseudomonadota bacterium]